VILVDSYSTLTRLLKGAKKRYYVYKLRRIIKALLRFYKLRRAEVESEGRVSCAEPLH
jgi:hypothetical protein